MTELRYYGGTHRVIHLKFGAKPQCPPYDTRDLTARICGDPLPGRSALDQKRLAEPLPVIEIAEPIE